MKFSDLDLSKSYSYADYLTWTFPERLDKMGVHRRTGYCHRDPFSREQ